MAPPPPPAWLPAALSHPAAALVATLLLAALLAFFLLRSHGGAGGGRAGGLLLVGPCGAGKTTLFLRLRDGAPPAAGTVASMQENDGTVRMPGGGSGELRLVDLPGHATFRHRLAPRLRDAAGVVFLLDAVVVTPHHAEAAELLYELLSSPGFAGRRPPLLIACNKADRGHDAHSPAFIGRTLEKQLDAMRRTRAASMGGGGADGGGGAAGDSLAGALQHPDKPFAFDGLRSKVTIAEMSALNGDVKAVADFAAACGLL